jgi:hypothetical protein
MPMIKLDSGSCIDTQYIGAIYKGFALLNRKFILSDNGLVENYLFNLSVTEADCDRILAAMNKEVTNDGE